MKKFAPPAPATLSVPTATLSTVTGGENAVNEAGRAIGEALGNAYNDAVMATADMFEAIDNFFS